MLSKFLFPALAVAAAGAAVIGLAIALTSSASRSPSVATPAASSSARPSPERERVTRPEEIVLRLTDLRAGYQIGDDSFCGPLSTEGMPPSLASIIRSDPPRVCFRQFEQGSRLQPDAIDSAVLIFSSDRSASDALHAFPELSLSASLTLSDHPSPVAIGDESRTFVARDVNSQQVGALIAWRNGPILQYVSVSPGSAPDPLAYAQQLASLQERRVSQPKPPRASDTDDRTAALDRSNLGVPVYWLGLDFPAGPALPALQLSRSEGPFEIGGGPGNRVKIDYAATGGRGAGVILTIWERQAWQSLLQTELGDLATAMPCGEPRFIELQDRRIEVHGAGELRDRPLLPRPPRLPGEPAQPEAVRGNPESSCPPGFVGHVYFEAAVVVINMPLCLPCTTPQGPYNSDEGIEAVARALELR